jgi:hypothetical protein
MRKNDQNRASKFKLALSAGARSRVHFLCGELSQNPVERSAGCTTATRQPRRLAAPPRVVPPQKTLKSDSQGQSAQPRGPCARFGNCPCSNCAAVPVGGKARSRNSLAACSRKWSVPMDATPPTGRVRSSNRPKHFASGK